jgi:thiol-disulfide isomerase/thioredoxin
MIPTRPDLPSQRPTRRPIRGGAAGFVLLFLFVLAAAGAAPAAAQPVPDPMFQGFEPIGTFAVLVDGETVPGARVYQSDRARAILVMNAGLQQPILFNLRSRQTARVPIMSLAQRQDGSMDILADARLAPAGSFAVSADGATAELDGKTVALRQRESLTGHRRAEELIEYDPTYARGADDYSPNENLLAELRGRHEDGGQGIRVEVFFNSKCGVCKQMVPRIIKVDRVLEDSVVEFDYYGVPDSYEDPLMDEKDVDGVPTGIVYVDGKEVGRIVGGEWKVPELAIKNTISQSS